jgi:hypothetical protein
MIERTLRDQFYCETDIRLEPTSEDWQQYALWLEKDVATRLNTEAIAENDLLRNAFFHVTDLLESTLTRPVAVGGK